MVPVSGKRIDRVQLVPLDGHLRRAALSSPIRGRLRHRVLPERVATHPASSPLVFPGSSEADHRKDLLRHGLVRLGPGGEGQSPALRWMSVSGQCDKMA